MLTFRWPCLDGNQKQPAKSNTAFRIQYPRFPTEIWLKVSLFYRSSHGCIVSTMVVSGAPYSSR